MTEEQKLKFIFERDEVLEKADVDEFIRFINRNKLVTMKEFVKENFPGTELDGPTERLVYEISMHQLIVVTSTVSPQRRAQSFQWLMERGAFDEDAEL